MSSDSSTLSHLILLGCACRDPNRLVISRINSSSMWLWKSSPQDFFPRVRHQLHRFAGLGRLSRVSSYGFDERDTRQGNQETLPIRTCSQRMATPSRVFEKNVRATRLLGVPFEPFQKHYKKESTRVLALYMLPSQASHVRQFQGVLLPFGLPTKDRSHGP